MATKHFINDPAQLVLSALRSIPRLNHSVALDEENKIIYVLPDGQDRVSIVSGGGSGHEPSFASFVGNGLLTAAVAGSIFASPSAEQVRKCILQRVNRENGVLVIIMNYTGDILHFGMAVEKAKAAGTDIELLVVGDDVGVGRKKSGRLGRRGIAGTVLVQKIAGALATAGASLSEVYKVSQRAAANLVSVGASLAHVHVPGRRQPLDTIMTRDEVEIGMGIHNEEGFGRVRTDLPGLVKLMLAQLLNQSDEDRAFIEVSAGDDFILLVNNLGGLSILELGGVTEEVCLQLYGTYSINPVRILSGSYMTSLNGVGFSISLLKCFDTGLGPGGSVLELLDAPAEASGWISSIQSTTWDRKPEAGNQGLEEERKSVMTSNLKVDVGHVKSVLFTALNRLIAVEPKVTEYDTIAGDGDCGLALKRGAEALINFLEHSKPSDDAAQLVAQFAEVIEGNMDGTSGALYAIFLNGLSQSLSSQNVSAPIPITPVQWGLSLRNALESLGKYTPAKPGDRTVIDALHPFIQTLGTSGNILEASLAAQAGCKATEGMDASLGRTVYVGGNAYKKVPDPGAYGLSELLLGVSDGVSKV